MRVRKAISVLLLAGLLGACGQDAGNGGGDEDNQAKATTGQSGQAAATADAKQDAASEWCREMAQTPKAEWSASQAQRFAEECSKAMKEKAEKAAEEAIEEREEPDDGGGTL